MVTCKLEDEYSKLFAKTLGALLELTPKRAKRPCSLSYEYAYMKNSKQGLSMCSLPLEKARNQTVAENSSGKDEGKAKMERVY